MELNKNFKENREEINLGIKNFQDSILQRMSETSQFQKNQLDIFSKQLIELTKTIENRLTAVTQTLDDKLSNFQRQMTDSSKENRDLIQNRLEAIQQDNSTKLEKMRETVDEKLHKTLEQRLGDSFKLVSERLEQVQKGLGEMQTYFLTGRKAG